MAKDKLYEARIAGYVAAFNKAKQEGLEALERDIKKRNLLKFDLNVSEKKMHEYFGELSKNLYHNALTAVAYTLHKDYGFGKKRIKEFKEAFDKNVQATLDLDYMGIHYVRMDDFAVELNERFNLGIDVNRVAVCQKNYDKDDKMYRMCKVDRILRELKENGFKEAAVFLEKKLE